MTFMSLENIEKAAEDIRKQLGLEKNQFIDPVTMLFKLQSGRFSERVTYMVARPPVVMEGEAFFDAAAKRIVLSSSVFAGAQANVPRARFTVCHEVVHALRHHSGVRHRHSVKAAFEKFDSDIRRDESEANRIAAAILCPEQFVPLDADVNYLMEYFCLSREAARIRLENIQAMRRRRSGVKRELPGFVLEYLQQAKSKGFKIRESWELTPPPSGNSNNTDVPQKINSTSWYSGHNCLDDPEGDEKNDKPYRR